MSDTIEQQNGAVEADADKTRPGLNLFVPPQAPPPPDTFLLDPKKTEAWFETLPKANVGETARRIYSTLVDFNRMELIPVLRARNAEQFREPVDYICQNLRRHFVDAGFPLREKGQKAAALARALYQELAIGYKSIIRDLLSGQGDRLDRKLLVVSLHRAASCLNQVLYYTALVYGSWPASLWREIHAIYAYAWQNRIHTIQVKHGQQRGANQSTLEDVYVCSLLFASAAPHRLRQGQQLALVEVLPQWTRHARLGMPDEGRLGPGQFQVDLFSDTPPMQDAADAPAANRRLRRLDLKQLLAQLRKLFDDTPWQGSAGSDTQGHRLSRQLLRTVIQSWGSNQERRFVRTRLCFDLHVVAGMNALHGHLLRVQQEAREETESGDRYASSFLHQRDTAPVDPWSEPYSHGLGFGPLTVQADPISHSLFNEGPLGSMLPDSVPSPTAPAPADQAQATPGHAVRTLNESAGGYCIQWQGDDVPRVRIGELLGIQSNTGEREFSLAAIRWMRQLSGQPLQFGVELLSPHCEAGEVTPTGDSRKQYPHTPQRCLVMRAPAKESNGCIILPSALFAVDTLLSLRHGEARQRIRLSQMVETTGAYARYQYEVAEPGTPQASSNEQADEFGDLWSSL